MDYASPQPCRLLPILIVVERVSAQGRDRRKTLKILLEQSFVTRFSRRRVTGSEPKLQNCEESFPLTCRLSQNVPRSVPSFGVSIKPRYYGPEGPICLRRVEAVVPSFLGPVAAIPRPCTIERRAPIVATKRTCFFKPRNHQIRVFVIRAHLDSYLPLLMDF
ncbi:hypothetical protein G5I_01838 [Acromyrmex echinatior]|uniref:Uncharacterized protein n=1 Tax=Acromyrmex echinatior TaxID=103372 RepID=F4W8Q6_ACREC|nr:hypothetical protein G5I_01838 [Acromyrmex echinatior]